MLSPFKKGKECSNIKNMAFMDYSLFKHTEVNFQASIQLYDAFGSPVPAHKNVSDQRHRKLFRSFNSPEHSNVGHLILGPEVHYWSWQTNNYSFSKSRKHTHTHTHTHTPPKRTSSLRGLEEPLCVNLPFALKCSLSNSYYSGTLKLSNKS